MLSGNLQQYITDFSETIVSNSTILKRIQLICPSNERITVMEDLWNSKWEITRSGPTDTDHSKQLIVATKETKL